MSVELLKFSQSAGITESVQLFQLHKHVNPESEIRRPALQGAFGPKQPNICSGALWNWSSAWGIVGPTSWLLGMGPPLPRWLRLFLKLLGLNFFSIQKWSHYGFSILLFFNSYMMILNVICHHNWGRWKEKLNCVMGEKRQEATIPFLKKHITYYA